MDVKLQDGFVFLNKLDKFSNLAVHPLKRVEWKLKEEAVHTTVIKNSKAINNKVAETSVCWQQMSAAKPRWCHQHK